MPDVRFASRPFKEQVAYFQRKVSVPTDSWLDLQRGDHAHAFVVAGIHRLDALNAIRDRILAAQRGEVSLEQFQKEFRTLGPDGGLEFPNAKARDARAKLIYETNLRQAYNAGRWHQFTSPDMRAARPYLMYRHNDRGYSRTPRPLHLSWHGLILPIDHPWWKTHAPMNGWGCKCGIRAMSKREVAAINPVMALDGFEFKAPDNGSKTWVDKTTGEEIEVPLGVDPGFEYNVGEASRSIHSIQAFSKRIIDLVKTNPDYARAALDDAVMRQVDWLIDWPAMIDDGVRALHGVPGHEWFTEINVATPFAFLRFETLQSLRSGVGLDGVEFSPLQVNDATLLLTGRRIIHGLRDKHFGGALEKVRPEVIELLKTLPSWASSTDASIYWEANAARLIVARPLPSDPNLLLEIRVLLNSPPFGRQKLIDGFPDGNWTPTLLVVPISKFKKRSGQYHVGGRPLQ